MEFSKRLVGSTSSTLILAVINEKDRHGYEIVQRVNELSNGLFEWREGTVYPALHRLENEGLIVGEWRAAETGHQRRVYRLTREGKGELQRQEREWTAFSTAVNRVLGDCHAT
jgi:transcriptional regulator